MAGGRPANKGSAAMRRVGGLEDADVVGPEDPGYRAELKRADAARNKAYRQGKGAAKRRVQETGRVRGHSPAQVHADPEHQEIYESGFGDELGDQRRQRREKRVAPVAKRASGAAHDGAGVLLGMFAYALFLAYVKGGWSGVTGWLGAKFLNKTNAASAIPPAPPSGSNWYAPGNPGNPSGGSSPKSGFTPGAGAGGGAAGGGGGSW